jgi:hypothetical protein
MEAVHQSNAARLREIIEQWGWPGKSLVGEDGAQAAWLIAQHAIGDPSFMKLCLSLLKEATSKGEASAWQAAMLEDRIRMYEGRPQVYGTQFQRDENGDLVPHEIEDAAGVDDRRRAVGFNTLEQRTAEMREQSARENAAPRENSRAEYEKWLRSVGWRDGE